MWRLDRLGRSLRHLIDTVQVLDERGVGFCSLMESIDTTTTAGGRLVFHLFGALAEFSATSSATAPSPASRQHATAAATADDHPR